MKVTRANNFAIARITAAKLRGQEIEVSQITNKWNNVDHRLMMKSGCFVRLHGDYSTELWGKACKELQIPCARYRKDWRKQGKKFLPEFDGVVVRVDHAETVRSYMRQRYRQKVLPGFEGKVKFSK